MATIKQILNDFPQYLSADDLVKLGLFSTTSKIYSLREKNPEQLPQFIPNLRDLLFEKSIVEEFYKKIMNRKRETIAPQIQTKIDTVVQVVDTVKRDHAMVKSVGVNKKEAKFRVSAYVDSTISAHLERVRNKRVLSNPDFIISDYIIELIERDRPNIDR